MGAYVNLKDGNSIEDKFKWLEENGVEVKREIIFEEIDNEREMYVCAVSNGYFIAVAIAYSKQELEVFKQEDGRKKYWFIVPIEKLKEVSDVEEYLKLEEK